ncbi:hypothetical protein NP233_g5131 [Leucocoprinus birnbaumii]|uniref:Uncharacterized protein n=1 Tax=Leucocoprinus birnbaumii TaxID=56174 RepID=A0AAD5VTW0_9AGAR|nr:hypothetical protein NP233_g5131 [Leucocoprinus birnbaumii]
MPSGAPSWFSSVLRRPQATTTVSQDVVVADTPAVESFSLAQRIQALIGSKSSTSSLSTGNTPSSSRSNAGQNDETAPTDTLATSFDDQELAEILRSPVIMNGSLDHRRTSVFDILDGIGSPRPRREAELSREDAASETFSDSSSVMVYSPLLPVQGSLVELAESEVIIEEEDDGDDEEDGPLDTEAPPAPPPIPGWSWASTLPTSLTSWFTTSVQQSSGPEPPMTPRTRARRIRAQRAWVPSKDQLSIQCMWWGYRIYLPPPVLDILDDKQLEAARRAAMITAALTWFFNNLPVYTLPLPLRPTLLLLQQIAPFLGSIGTFISWGWTMIKAYDQGYGVTLTATWLLPIALIPGTWFERDWPISPPPPDFTPLPSIDAVVQASYPATSTTATPHSNFLPTPEATPTPRANQRELPWSPQSTPRQLNDTSIPLPGNSYIYQSPPTSPYTHFGSRPLAASTPLQPGTPYIIPSPLYNPGILPTANAATTPLPPPSPYIIYSPPSSPPMSPPMPPHHYPSSSTTISSPALSYATAPNSPAAPSPPALPASPPPSSPSRLRASLAGLVAKSPVIRVRKSKRAASSPLTGPSTSIASDQSPNSTPYTQSQAYSMYSPILPSTPLPYQHQYNIHDLHATHHEDARLLQSPVWQCSPLPPEQALHHDT